MRRIVVLMLAICLSFVQIPVIAFADDVENQIELSSHSVTLYLCDDYEKTITATGTGTVEEGTVVEWSIEDESIATVKDGVFTPVSLGETVAYAKYGNVVADLNVEVLKPEIVADDYIAVVVGETARINLEEKTPQTCKVTFTSDNEEWSYVKI